MRCGHCFAFHESKEVMINTARGALKVSTCPHAGKIGGIAYQQSLGFTPTHVCADEIDGALMTIELERKEAHAAKVRQAEERIRIAEERERAEIAARLCFECAEPGKHKCEHRPNTWRCDRCELQYVREMLHDRHEMVVELLRAILSDEEIGVRSFDVVVPNAVTKAGDHRRAWDAARDAGYTYGLAPSKPNALRGENASGKALRVHQEFVLRQQAAWQDAAARTLDSMAGSFLRYYNMHYGKDRSNESGPGLAARYLDATPAQQPEQEIVTCDLGVDWE